MPTSIMPSSTWCLQRAAVLLPSKLHDGHLVQESCEQCLILRMFTMPLSACRLQQIRVLLPFAQKLGYYVQDSRRQFFLLMTIMPWCCRTARLTRGVCCRKSPRLARHASAMKHLRGVEG